MGCKAGAVGLDVGWFFFLELGRAGEWEKTAWPRKGAYGTQFGALWKKIEIDL